MREIRCWQLGICICLGDFAEFPSKGKDLLNKKTKNKQANNQTDKQTDDTTHFRKKCFLPLSLSLLQKKPRQVCYLWRVEGIRFWDVYFKMECPAFIRCIFGSGDFSFKC